jgi:peptidoglycan/xylan/chitin deacetylase (PgdA/CDA1 family)
MNALLKKLTQAASQRIPLEIYSKLVPRNRLAFCYHLVSDERLAHISNVYNYKTSEMFLDDLNYLMGSFQVVGLKDFLKHPFIGSSSDKPVSMVSFDDGLAQAYSVAKPILDKLNLSAAFFLAVDFIDNRSMMYRHKGSLCIEKFENSDESKQKSICKQVKSKWGRSCPDVDSFCLFILSLRGNRTRIIDEMCEALDVDINGYLKAFKPYLSTEQIKTLVDAGYDIGAHSMNHLDFNRLSFHEIEHQVVRSCKYIAEMTGRSPVHFAAPFTLNRTVKEMLKRILRENSVVGTIFGISGVLDEPPFVQRIIADSPECAFPGKSNLPSVLKKQYAKHIFGSFQKRFAI